MQHVVMIAEKPSIAETVAQALANQERANVNFRKSIGIATPVLEWNGVFKGQPAAFKMTSVTGHVHKIDFEAKLNDWNSVDPVHLFHADPVIVPASSKGRTIAHLQKECDRADAVVLWLDCDREGDHICYEILDCILNKMKDRGGSVMETSVAIGMDGNSNKVKPSVSKKVTKENPKGKAKGKPKGKAKAKPEADGDVKSKTKGKKKNKPVKENAPKNTPSEERSRQRPPPSNIPPGPGLTFENVAHQASRPSHLDVEALEFVPSIQQQPVTINTDSVGSLARDKDNESWKKMITAWSNTERKRLDAYRNRIYRAHFSSLAESDLCKAFKELQIKDTRACPYSALAVDARQELDLKVGVAFTRLLTKYFQGKYADLNSNCISYGPCQTPTLNFVVERQDRIANFVPEPFWSLSTELVYFSCTKTRTSVPVSWGRGRLFDRAVVELFKARVETRGVMTVTAVKNTLKKKGRPCGLNTPTFLGLASSVLGIGPQQALRHAETLYLSGLVTYPRTETTGYAAAFDAKGVIRSLNGYETLRMPMLNEPKDYFSDPKRGKNAGDHPPITPTVGSSGHHLSGDLRRVYDLIVRHFLASFSHDAEFQNKKLELECANETFQVSTTSLVKEGFMRCFLRDTCSLYEEMDHYGEDLDDENEAEQVPVRNINIPEDVAVGAQLFIEKGVRVTTGKTKPPSLISEAELIKSMERSGVGTDATMAQHIQNVQDRNYVELAPGGGRRLTSTALGRKLIHGFMEIDPQLVLPKVRSTVEALCNKISLGEANYVEAMLLMTRQLKLKFQYFIASIHQMDLLFQVAFTTLAAASKPFSRCGHCTRYMNLIEQTPPRLYCNWCSKSYKLPHGGKIKPYQNLKCPLDNFELCLAASKNGRMIPFCPLCYNDAPFEDGVKPMDCLNCLHPTCKHSLSKNVVCRCPDTNIDGSHCSGHLVYDKLSAPKYKLQCNAPLCRLVVNFPERLLNDLKVETKSPPCVDCGANLIQMQLHKECSLEGLSGTLTTCMFCNPVIYDNLELSEAKTFRPRNKAATRGRGRGGRGGRGGRR